MLKTVYPCCNGFAHDAAAPEKHVVGCPTCGHNHGDHPKNSDGTFYCNICRRECAYRG